MPVVVPVKDTVNHPITSGVPTLPSHICGPAGTVEALARFMAMSAHPPTGVVALPPRTLTSPSHTSQTFPHTPFTHLWAHRHCGDVRGVHRSGRPSGFEGRSPVKSTATPALSHTFPHSARSFACRHCGGVGRVHRSGRPSPFGGRRPISSGGGGQLQRPASPGLAWPLHNQLHGFGHHQHPQPCSGAVMGRGGRGRGKGVERAPLPRIAPLVCAAGSAFSSLSLPSPLSPLGSSDGASMQVQRGVLLTRPLLLHPHFSHAIFSCTHTFSHATSHT